MFCYAVRRHRIPLWLAVLVTLGLVTMRLSTIEVRSAESELAVDSLRAGAKKSLDSGRQYPWRNKHLVPSKPIDSVIPDMFYKKQPNISKHDFRLMLNPESICDGRTDEDIYLVVMIASASWEFERREIIRRTWASSNRILGKRVLFLFFTANDGVFRNNAKLAEEFSVHRDIVQEDFGETYRNLTLKTQGQLKWATQFCSGARLFMHVDDDVVPDIVGIIKQHKGVAASQRKISCAKVFKPKVRREGKWITSLEEYPGDQYPLSCVGWCFVMPRDVAYDLYVMSLETPLLHLEDVAVTGILREKVGDIEIKKMKDGENLCMHKGWPKDRPTNLKIIEAWRKIKVRHRPQIL